MNNLPNSTTIDGKQIISEETKNNHTHDSSQIQGLSESAIGNAFVYAEFIDGYSYSDLQNTFVSENNNVMTGNLNISTNSQSQNNIINVNELETLKLNNSILDYDITGLPAYEEINTSSQSIMVTGSEPALDTSWTPLSNNTAATISVTGPTQIVSNSIYIFSIKNFNSFDEYDVTFSDGSLRSFDRTFGFIQYDSPSTAPSEKEVTITIENITKNTTKDIIVTLIEDPDLTISYFDGTSYVPVNGIVTVNEEDDILLQIDTYSTSVTYNISASQGTVNRTDDIITVNPPLLNDDTTISVTINDVTVDINVIAYQKFDLSPFRNTTEPTGVIKGFSGATSIASMVWRNGFTYYVVYDNTVYQYSASFSYTIGGSSYDNQSYDVVAATGQGVQDISFDNTGTRMYNVRGGSAIIHQHDISSNPWNINFANYNNVSIDLSSDPDISNFLRAIDFKNDGTKMFLLSATDRIRIIEYDLSTPWEITTATKVRALPLNDTVPDSVLESKLHFRYDGSELLILAGGVFSFTLSTPWDISTMVYNDTYFNDYAGRFNSDFSFKSDGSKIFMVAKLDNTIIEYENEISFKPGTIAPLRDQISNTIQTYSNNADGYFKEDGTEVYLYVNYFSSPNSVDKYTLSTPWDLSTATLDNSTATTDASGEAAISFYFKDDGTKIYRCTDDPNRETITQYSLSTPWDVSTESQDNVTIFSESTNMKKFMISEDGGSLYIFFENSNIYQYTLSTPWELSTASYSNKVFSLYSQIPPAYLKEATFNIVNSGRNLFVNANNYIYQYILSTPWDISTTTYDNVSTITQTLSYCALIGFNNDGTTLFLADDEIKQYELYIDVENAVSNTSDWTVATVDYNASFKYFTDFRILDSDNIIGVGFSRVGSDDYAMIIKLDKDLSTILAQKRIGSTNEQFRGSTQSYSGGYVAVGDQRSDTSNAFAGFIVEYDSNLNVVHQKTYSKNGIATIFEDVIQDSDGGYIVIGTDFSTSTTRPILIKYDSNWNLLSEKAISYGSTTVRMSRAISTPDGGGAAVGLLDDTNRSGYIAKFDKDLNITSQSEFETSDDETFMDIKKIQGGYIVSGECYYTTGTRHGLFCVYDEQLNLLNHELLLKNSAVILQTCAVRGDDSYISAGYYDTGEGKFGGLISTFDNNGDFVSNVSLEATTTDTVIFNSSDTSSDGTVYISGYVAHSSTSNYSPLIVKLPNNMANATGSITNHSDLSWTDPTGFVVFTGNNITIKTPSNSSTDVNYSMTNSSFTETTTNYPLTVSAKQ